MFSGFRKATLGGGIIPLWGLGCFKTCLWALRKRDKCCVIINLFVSYVKRNSFLYQFYSFNFWRTWSFLYPRFTNHFFNCSRWLLIFSFVEQILLNLTNCPYVIDPLYTLLWHDYAWRYWCVSVGLQYKSFSNLLPTFVTVTPENLFSVVEQSMVNLIVGRRLFIQLKNSFNFLEP